MVAPLIIVDSIVASTTLSVLFTNDMVALFIDMVAPSINMVAH